GQKSLASTNRRRPGLITRRGRRSSRRNVPARSFNTTKEPAMRGCALLTLMLLTVVSPTQAGWKAGVGRVTITPDQPLWMSGYASRNHAATGRQTDLWAKALVLEDEQGRRGVIISLDLVGIDRDTSLEIRNRLIEKHDLAMA